MENKSSEDRPPADLTLVFSPHPGKLGRRSLVHELVTQLGLDAGTGVIHMVSSDRLCNTAESAAETPTPHLQQSNNAAPSKDPLGHSETLHSLSAGEETMTEAVCEVLVGLCRHAGLLAPRASLVSLKEQHQALLLCLARQNKEVNGDFSADASELLAAWKIMKRDAFKAPARDKLDCNESEDLPSQEVRTLLSSYVSFVSSCNYIDVFTLHRALCALVAAQDLIQSKVVVVEGVVSKLEWLLLQPLLTASHRVYVALRDGNSPLKSDSCDVTDMDCWQLRRVDTDGVATDKLLCACFCSSSNAVITSSEVATTSSAVPTTLTEVTTTSSAVVTTSSAVATSAITTTPAKAKVAGLLRGSPITPTHKNGLCSSVVSSACSPCHTPRRQGPGMESLLYVRQVMVCQLRLLLNTRDEMALALNCSLPGTAMSPAAFADIKQEARRINMPMFQTIMSVVQKRRLGGSGYQLASNSSILAHVAPLTDFVDHINALSTVVEDVTCVRTAARQILMSIKRYVAKQCTGVQAQKCPVKISTIEVVHKGLQSRLDRCLRRFESYQDVASSFGGSSIYGKIGSNTNKATRLKLPYPVLSLLQSLCDRCMSECSFNDDSVASFVSLCEGDGGEMVMSQRGGSPIAFTPVRVPSVLTLFHTPPPGEDLHGEEVIAEPSLRVRLMKGRRSTPVRSQRHLSCMAWAPDNLSPVQVDASPVFTSPLPPPRPTSQEVLAAIAELPDRNMEVSNAGSPKNLLNEKRKAGRRQREVLPGPKRSLLKDISNLEANVVNTKEASASINKKLISQNESDRTVSHPKRSSKRSLLSDIDNLAPHIEGCKKSKTEPTRKRAGKKAIDKQLPAGQKSIASFFITKSK